jgi:hypothetical protein
VIWSRTDRGLFIGGLGLSLIGAMLVWSATPHPSGSEYLARHPVPGDRLRVLGACPAFTNGACADIIRVSAQDHHMQDHHMQDHHMQDHHIRSDHGLLGQR